MVLDLKDESFFFLQIAVRQLFDNDPSHAISNLKKDDIRIIVGLFYEEKARKVFCKVSTALIHPCS